MFICNVSEINYLQYSQHSLLVFKFSHPGPKNKCNDKFICKWIKLGLGNVNIEIGTGSREKYRYHRINTPGFDSTVV